MTFIYNDLNMFFPVKTIGIQGYPVDNHNCFNNLSYPIQLRYSTVMLINGRIINSLSSTSTWSIMTGVLVIILILDGVVTNLPSYNIQSRQSLAAQIFFVAEVLISIVIQLVYLRVIKQKYEVNPTIGHFKKYTDVIHYAVTVTQFAVIALLLAILVEIQTSSQYHSIILLIDILMSLFLSVAISGILAFRFLLWVKNKRDYLIIAYAVAAALISTNSIFIGVFISLEMQGKPAIIQPFVFWSNYQVINYDLHKIQSNILFSSFIALWIASALLLRSQRRKWGAI